MNIADEIGTLKLNQVPKRLSKRCWLLISGIKEAKEVKVEM
jgi:hypothetical protein